MTVFVNPLIIKSEHIAKVAVVPTDGDDMTYRQYADALTHKIDGLIEDYIQSQKAQAGINNLPFSRKACLRDIAKMVTDKLGTYIDTPDEDGILTAILNAPTYERFIFDVRDAFKSVETKLKATLKNVLDAQQKEGYDGEGVSIATGKAILEETDLYEFIEVISSYGEKNINYAK